MTSPDLSPAPGLPGLITGGQGPLERVLAQRGLYPVFQPIVSLVDGTVYAHEALVRGPVGGELHTPDKLIRAAAEEQLSFEFESAALAAALRGWGATKAPGRLFANISSQSVLRLCDGDSVLPLLDMVHEAHVMPRMLVLELTEHEQVSDIDALVRVIQQVRQAGIGVALDDFGDGHSSLRLWSQLKPQIVKIDKYFARHISANADKLKTLQALMQIAETFGSELVAEGIESADDLRVVRDLGLSFGQGYLLGHPDRYPVRHVDGMARRVLNERRLAVFPELGRVASTGLIRDVPLIAAPTATPDTSNDELAHMFLARSELHAIALLQDDRPVGIINRANFMNEYSKLYYREVWGKKPCVVHANMQPRIVEREHSVDQLIGILTSQDQRYLVDGFIMTENGRYIGIGTGDQLVRSVTETRIEAARHANPLTFLPGNIPISQHMERLLRKRVHFVACYADLNHFKPFNDYYGYWRGDEMIRLAAQIAMTHCDPQCDFLGHVGGDDFILLFQSADWRQRCESLVEEFNARARAMFDPKAQAAGGIEAEDRHGVMRFFPCTSLSMGAAVIESGSYSRPEEVANLAALAKQDAKRLGVGVSQRSS
jgi:EAL domain-containing protein (putative c-di-GMP-specific phosphodiesterase class I)/GGDEF domain-containing protein